MRFSIALLSAMVLLGCSAREETSYAESDSHESHVDSSNAEITSEEDHSYGIESKSSNHSFSAKIIFTDSLGWGYQIFEGNKMMINQTHIPSIQGNKGFDTRQAAQITANFVLYKLSNNIFPPTLNKKELDSLGVI